ncbi:ABC transporter-related protein [Mycolicibacterium vanbaalenii PYR-1]|uniref:ABC transporter-related protein n=1 Tax=Mycolicibacterium vanbaalenii (strain DSM 7251 / JCM 13017 / BCRC 16820 / KCTC 9966 / NRRL B-24157 / PYR-1) TaxID=350058 RepID=A1T9U3_MYCVP|nr:ABC transporter-related protein [Mycolicibacterium vanbaalenii PYR-1]
MSRTFGAVDALAPCDLAVKRGEFISIIGPSGCGKSTLLRLASKLDEPTAGAVEFATDSVGYVFQDATLMPWRTVRRNVGLLAELQGRGRAEIRSEVESALATVGLTDFAEHLPRQLSGGMKMRASLARSLVLKPEVFLFDEPFGALDEITRGRLNLVLQDLFLQHSFAGLFVTHSVEEAVFLSNRVVVMSARPGRIVDEFTVPFEFPRALELRYQPEFAELAGRVAKSLEEAS